jgi:azurin
VHVEVTAPTFQLAKSIADDVVAALRPNLLGDPSRIVAVTIVDAGGGEQASVTIRTAR